MKSFIAALLALMAVTFPPIVADIEFPDLRYLKAYTEFDYEGLVSEFLDYVPDLSVPSLDNAIRSVCYTGLWILYDDVNYGREITLFYDISTCSNLSSLDYDKASSLRYAGSPYDLNDVYYNLYETINFGGAEFKGNTNAATVDLNVSSLAINGQSPWTFFTGFNYTGTAACVYPYDFSTGDISWDMYFTGSIATLGLPDNSIRSVAKGCVSERVVRALPSEASPHADGDQKAINNKH